MILFVNDHLFPHVLYYTQVKGPASRAKLKVKGSRKRVLGMIAESYVICNICNIHV